MGSCQWLKTCYFLLHITTCTIAQWTTLDTFSKKYRDIVLFVSFILTNPFLHYHCITLYPLYPVSSLPCILSTLYPLYPVSSLPCIISTLYPLYPVSSLPCILCTLCPLYPVSSLPCILSTLCPPPNTVFLDKLISSIISIKGSNRPNIYRYR